MDAMELLCSDAGVSVGGRGASADAAASSLLLQQQQRALPAAPPTACAARSRRCGATAARCTRQAGGPLGMPLLMAVALALAVLSAARPAAALYHTASETLHWFAHKAAARPDIMRCAARSQGGSCWRIARACRGRLSAVCLHSISWNRNNVITMSFNQKQ